MILRHSRTPFVDIGGANASPLRRYVPLHADLTHAGAREAIDPASYDHVRPIWGRSKGFPSRAEYPDLDDRLDVIQRALGLGGIPEAWMLCMGRGAGREALVDAVDLNEMSLRDISRGVPQRRPSP